MKNKLQTVALTAAALILYACGGGGNSNVVSLSASPTSILNSISGSTSAAVGVVVNSN